MGHGDAEVGGRPVTPLLLQRDSPASGDLDRREEVAVPKTRCVADDVDLVQRAVGRHHPLGDDVIDRRTDQVNVRCGQASQPRAIVLQHPLTHGWVVGGRLVDQVGPIGEQRLHPGRKHLPALGIRRIDPDAVGGAKIGVDAVLIDPTRDAAESHHEAKPPAVEGQMALRPLVARRHFRVIHAIRDDPLRGPLEDRQRPDLIGDRRRDLEAAGAGPDEREP